MKRIGVREFRDHATRYLAGDDVLAVERNGHQIGFYIPTATSRHESALQALERLQRAVDEVAAETGLTEDEIRRLLDLREQVPEISDVNAGSSTAEAHASRR